MNVWDLSLNDQRGEMVEMKDFLGRWVVIYVYPEDDTPGCTIEACSFRDLNEAFLKRGIRIIGVSKDSVDSHENFVTKYGLSFVLLSDPERKLIGELGALKEDGGTMRNTYVFNPKGNLVKEYIGVNPLGHARMVLRDIELLKNRPQAGEN